MKYDNNLNLDELPNAVLAFLSSDYVSIENNISLNIT